MEATFPGALEFWRHAIDHLRALEPVVTVFGDQPTDEESRDGGYVIVDPDPGYPSYERACGGQSEQSYRVDLRCCGHSPAQMINTVDKVRARMRGFAPWPDGRWSLVREVSANPSVLDDTVPTDPRWSTTLAYHVEG